jgi:AI-2 transport protein TqsA
VKEKNMSKNSGMSWDSICLSFVATVCLTFSLIYLKSILVPFAISVFLYFLVSPVIDMLQVKGNLPRFLSTVITIFCGVLIGAIILLSFFISIKLFAPDAGSYQIKLQDFALRLRDFLANNGVELSKDLVFSNLSTIPIVPFLKDLTGSLVGFFGNSLLVLVILLFLIEGKDPKRKRHPKIVKATNKINSYVRHKFLTSLGTGILVWLVLTVLRVDLAGMFGVLTFLLNFIPSVGSIIAIVLPLPIVLVEHGFGGVFILALVLPAAIQFLVGNVIEPKLMGDSLGLHPVAQLFALLFWGAIWGISGMFLAVPIVVILKLFLEQYEQTQRLAGLLAGRIAST